MNELGAFLNQLMTQPDEQAQREPPPNDYANYLQWLGQQKPPTNYGSGGKSGGGMNGLGMAMSSGLGIGASGAAAGAAGGAGLGALAAL